MTITEKEQDDMQVLNHGKGTVCDSEPRRENVEENRDMVSKAAEMSRKQRQKTR